MVWEYNSLLYCLEVQGWTALYLFIHNFNPFILTISLSLPSQFIHDREWRRERNTVEMEREREREKESEKERERKREKSWKFRNLYNLLFIPFQQQLFEQFNSCFRLLSDIVKDLVRERERERERQAVARERERDYLAEKHSDIPLSPAPFWSFSCQQNSLTNHFLWWLSRLRFTDSHIHPSVQMYHSVTQTQTVKILLLSRPFFHPSPISLSIAFFHLCLNLLLIGIKIEVVRNVYLNQTCFQIKKVFDSWLVVNPRLVPNNEVMKLFLSFKKVWIKPLLLLYSATVNFSIFLFLFSHPILPIFLHWNFYILWFDSFHTLNFLALLPFQCHKIDVTSPFSTPELHVHSSQPQLINSLDPSLLALVKMSFPI